MTRTLARLLVLADAPRGRVALFVLLGTATVAFGAGLMATAGYLISRAAERPAVLSLSAAIVAVRFFGLARPVCRYFERVVSHDLSFRVLARVRAHVYGRIEPLAPGQLGAYRHGDLLARFVADVDALQNLHLRGVGPPLVAVAAGGVSVAFAAAFLPAAAIVLAAGLLAAGLLVPLLEAASAARATRREAGARGELTAQLVELAMGAPELAAFGCEDERIGRLRGADGALVELARKAAFADGAGEALRLVISGATLCGVLAVTIDAHALGRLDRVLIAMLALLALASFEAVQPLSRVARELRETAAAGTRILELTEREPEIRDPDRPLQVPRRPFAISFESVSVRYAGQERLALEGFSLRLDPGRRIALLGPSGAGKTTVVNLLLRFVDPEQGRVTLAGRDLREYRQDDLHRLVAVAAQDAHLFSASIRDNIRLGRTGATGAEVEDALRRAQLTRWVETLPEGLDTRVGENGRELSGGQRQQIALARALLVHAPVLVLDEPTAHLDPPSATRLLEGLLAADDARSVLLVTHRPEGLDLVDEIRSLAGRSDSAPEAIVRYG